ncbi:SRPBCC family protein [Kytococcus sedentarius]|uniref:SRPBCC family protein n=1 Tax=Kytococcus sedentarius TaxID=1276 RepID=UPI0035BC6101
MTTQLTRALIGSPDRPELTFRRTYPVTSAELREACTDPGRLARWFGKVEGNPAAVGDRFTVQLSEELDDRAVGRVEACLPDGFEVSWSWQQERVSRIVVRISPVSEGAELTVRHALAEPEHAGGYGGGWESMFAVLDASLAGVAEPQVDPAAEEAAVATWGTLGAHPLALEHSFDAPLDAVWAAFASAGGLRRWWWSHWPDVSIEADVCPGGHYRIEAPEAGVVLSGTYLVVDEGERLAMTWEWADADGHSRDEAVDLRFARRGEGTMVAVWHTGPWGDDQPAEGYRQGWESTLSQLDAVV